MIGSSKAKMKEKEYIEIVKLHSKAIYRFLYKNYNDVAICEDIVQETFSKLWEKRKEIDTEKAKPWLYKVAYHRLIDNIRANKKFATQSDDEIFINQNSTYNDSKELVNTYLEFLSLRQKSLIVLRDIEGYEYQDIAEILEIELSSVKVGLFRARKKIKELIEKNEIWISK